MKTSFQLAAGLLVLAGLIAPAQAQEVPAAIEGVKIVTAEQASDMLKKGVPLIDTRTANEFAEKSAKGAILVAYKEKSSKVAEFDRTQDSFDLAKLPGDKNAPLIFYCNAASCWKSYKASVVTRDAGYKQVHWMRGGMPEWVARGLPVQ